MHHRDVEPSLIAVERMCDRILAAREAITRAGRPFVLNARADPYLVRGDVACAEENFAEAVRRARAYAAAGADCVFIPGVADAATVGRLVTAIAAPLNVLGARGGREAGLTIAEFERLGVRRVSIGGSLALAAMGFVRDALAGMRQGIFGFGQHAPTNAEMDGIMAGGTSGGMNDVKGGLNL
ncbi:isocitrate lyase/phosphoenolpyruvate mutase family protein [Methylobacterium sp. NEAU 140]|uniref:isocitrate lyase/phosphoenolpyruvate mutase family protein n=1 Tax=Methylobacterium sp. NEAU 140 TaxID=3064945 RepID=UPI002732FCA5|nr:isocitrate lyase/phosphoenolpyruvate mutase family protein [Methylobacterium sp. NEAU 140]MDP4027144.1 isocitrate lyase/phosphoenolpyruvate mutase family protein [Methylobacterium sp. NEAU 140]